MARRAALDLYGEIGEAVTVSRFDMEDGGAGIMPSLIYGWCGKLLEAEIRLLHADSYGDFALTMKMEGPEIMTVRVTVAFNRINSEALARLPEFSPAGYPMAGGKGGNGRHGTRAAQTVAQAASGLISIPAVRADFATNDRGGDAVSLAAYLGGISQIEAAVHLAEMMGVDPYE